MSKPLKEELVYFGAALLLWSAVAHSAVEDVLARFEGGQIRVSELEAAIANKDLHTRRRLATTEGRISFMREVTNYELLVREAERRGYANHPAVIDARRGAAIEAMLATDLKVAPASIPAADVEREFATRLALAGRPSKPPRLRAVEGALREELAQQWFERARNDLLKRLSEQHKPEIHADLVDRMALEPAGQADQPAGFPAAPPDPRAASKLVESDGI